MQRIRGIGLWYDENRLASIFSGPLEAILNCRNIFCGKVKSETVFDYFPKSIFEDYLQRDPFLSLTQVDQVGNFEDR